MPTAGTRLPDSPVRIAPGFAPVVVCCATGRAGGVRAERLAVRCRGGVVAVVVGILFG
jgi:hypothetical protein